jgi:hypothetical protein
MFFTGRTGGSIEPGWPEVIPLPKMMDDSEPGGVNCTPPEVLVGDVDIQTKSQFLVEELGPIDVRDRYEQNF